jgi:cysteine desulfurase
MLYFDHQATTPVEDAVVKVMEPLWSLQYGNPHSSEHSVGWKAHSVVESAASCAADFVGAELDEIVFTSGATEGNNLAMFALCEAAASKSDSRQILVSPLEHKCVLNAASFWAKKNNLNLSFLRVDKNGFIDLDYLDSIIKKEKTSFCSIGYVNNEIGTVQDIGKISEILREQGVLFHSDCAQAPKTRDCQDIAALVDISTFSAHKFGGPPGIGFMAVSSFFQESFVSLMQGGGQQNGLRSGTVPMPLAAGLGEACKLLTSETSLENRKKMEINRNAFWSMLTEAIPRVSLNGPPLAKRHLGNLNVQFDGTSSQSLLMGMQPKLSASTGSACGSGNIEPSHVLRAIGLSEDKAKSSLRFSFNHTHSKNDLINGIEILLEAVLKQTYT